MVAHVPALFGGYVLDDNNLLVENPYVRSLAGLRSLVASELFVASAEARAAPYYRPASGALYWLSYQLFGTHALLQHALNLLLHAAIAATLVAVVAKRTASRRLAATLLVVTGCFAAHPATPDIVAYIGGRQDMLGWLVVLLGWLVCEHVRPGPKGLGLVAFGVTTLGALSREYFFAGPLLLLPLAIGRENRRLRAAAGIVAGGTLGVGAVLLLRRLLQIPSFEVEGRPVTALLDAAGGLAHRLLCLVFFPADISVNVTPSHLGVAGGALVLLALATATAGALALVWRDRAAAMFVAFGAACGWSTLALHLPVLLQFGALSDRYGYGVILGMAAAACGAAQRLPSPARVKPWLATALGVAAVLALIPSTWARDAEWRDEAHLQRAMYARRPEDPESRLAEGLRNLALDEHGAAYEHCLAYERARPASDRAALCLGAVFLRRGEPRPAAQRLEPYARARPAALESRVLLFRAWFAAGDLDGVERGLTYFRQYGSESPDLVAAGRELARRRREPAPGLRPTDIDGPPPVGLGSSP